MTVERTYRCNLCHAMHEPDRIFGVYWEGTNLRNPVQRPARAVEHHICPDCVAGVRSFALPQPGDQK